VEISILVGVENRRQRGNTDVGQLCNRRVSRGAVSALNGRDIGGDPL
jgi:hypothetical protein